VTGANVNLMTGAATVTYDPAATTPERLVETIRGTGYGAELPLPEESGEALVGAQDQARAEEIADLRRKLTVSLSAAALAMVFSMPLAELTGHGAPDPLMRFMMPLTDALRRVAPWLDRLTADQLRYLLLVLTLPVIGWAGRHFFTRAWAAFRHHSADMKLHREVGTGRRFSTAWQ
jgi:Cu+-exporting ATPase